MIFTYDSLPKKGRKQLWKKKNLIAIGKKEKEELKYLSTDEWINKI